MFAVGRLWSRARLDLLALLVLLFLTIWSLGRWFRPVGPTFYDTYWLPYVIVGVVVALLLIAALSVLTREVPGTRTGRASETQREVAAATAFGLSFWFFLIAAVAAIIASHIV
jgi:hypothetical protein